MNIVTKHITKGNIMHDALFDPRIKLRHISCMIEVTRQGGVVAASQVLGLSQPAVSKSVAELEKLLGVKLFDRRGRKLELTREGDVFARHAIGAAASLREGIESIDSARARNSTVRIGVMSTVESSIMPRATAVFLRGPLACTVLLESGSSLQLLNMLRDGQLDFYAGRLADPILMEGLVFEKLFSDRVVFVVRPSHPLCKKVEITFQDLVGQTMILPPVNAIGRQIMDTVMIAGGIGAPKREIQTLSNEIGRNFTRDTNAVWAVAHSVVSQDLIDGKFCALPLDTSNSQGPVGIIKRSDDELTNSSIAMIEAIRHETRNF